MFITLNDEHLVFVAYSARYRLKRFCKSLYSILIYVIHSVPTSLELGFYLLPDPSCSFSCHLAKTMKRPCDISLASLPLLNRSSACVKALGTIGLIKLGSCWRSVNARKTSKTRMTLGIIGFIPYGAIQGSGGEEVHQPYRKILSQTNQSVTFPVILKLLVIMIGISEIPHSQWKCGAAFQAPGAAGWKLHPSFLILSAFVLWTWKRPYRIPSDSSVGGGWAPLWR